MALDVKAKQLQIGSLEVSSAASSGNLSKYTIQTELSHAHWGLYGLRFSSLVSRNSKNGTVLPWSKFAGVLTTGKSGNCLEHCLLFNNHSQCRSWTTDCLEFLLLPSTDWCEATTPLWDHWLCLSLWTLRYTQINAPDQKTANNICFYSHLPSYWWSICQGPMIRSTWLQLQPLLNLMEAVREDLILSRYLFIFAFIFLSTK